MVRKVFSEMDPEAARAAAASIYTLFFPLLLADAVRRAHPLAYGQFHLLTEDGAALAPGLQEDDPRVIVSSAWIDLTQGPVVVRMPHMYGRHFDLTLIDTAGEPFASLGSRTGDDTGADLAVVGPHWTGEIRRGLRAQRATSDACWIVSRIHAFSALDKADAVAVAKRQFLTHLDPSGARRGAGVPMLEPPSASCLRQATEMTPALFFHRLDAIFERAPANFQRSHKVTLEALKAELGGPERAAGWTSDFGAALAQGFTDAVESIRTAAETDATPQGVGWWAPGVPAHGVSASPLIVAARAHAGLGAPMRAETVTLVCHHDERGRMLWGTKSYRIHFPEDGLPPVHGFWRLNTRPPPPPDLRHGLGNRNDLALNPDGSLDLVIQRSPPQASEVDNWLAAPEGQMSLVMRLYAPRPSVLKGAWRMPAVTSIDDPGPGTTSRTRRTSSTRSWAPPSSDLASPEPIWRESP